MNFKKEFQRGPNVYLVELDKLTLPVHADDAPRHNFGDLDQLARSLAITIVDGHECPGQEFPIKVRAEGEKIIVTDGARRTKAAELANEKGYGAKKITHLFAMLEEKGTDPVERIGKKLTANLSKPFEPEELGETFKNLRDKHHKSVAEIAEIAKVSTTKVKEYLLFVDKAPAAMKKQVREKKLKPSTAIKAIHKGTQAVEDVTLQSELGQKVKGRDVISDMINDEECDTPPEFVLKDLLEWLKDRGFKTFSQAKSDGTVYKNNIEIKIDQKEPKFIGVLVK